MGWLKKWRERGASKSAEREQQESTLTTHQIIEQIERASLERAKFESEMRLAELKATSEDRAEERAYDRRIKEANRAARAKAAENARLVRSGQRLSGRQQSNCPVCANPMRLDVTPAMIQEHRKHAPLSA